MNNKGFAKWELLVVVLIFSLVYFGTVISFSHAFSNDDVNIEYENKKMLIEKNSILYAQNNEKLFEGKTEIYVSIKTLAEENYIASNDKKEVIDPRNTEKNLNNLKVKIVKNDEDYFAVLIDEL